MKLRCPDDYRVVMVDFPGDVLAAVRVDCNGYYTVYINDRLSLQAKREALKHELNHILQGDYDNHYTIYDIEKRAAAKERIAVNLKSNMSFVPEEDFLKMIQVGKALFVDAFGPTPCTEPLWMPEPMFDREPDRWINRPGKW